MASITPELCFITPADPRYPSELELRFRVLREPLGLPREAVTFPFEEQSLHLVACAERRVVGCVLFHPESAERGRLFQMAVAPELQGRGLGQRLVRRLEEALVERAVLRVHLHAREPVVGFYERLGYAVHGAPFVEVGVPHRHMRRSL